MQPDHNSESSYTHTIVMFAESFRLNYGRLVTFAERLLRRARTPESEYAPEDAVQSGFLMLLDDVAKGKLKSVNGFHGCNGLLRKAIAQEIVDQRRRRDAVKRGGRGVRRAPPTEPEIDRLEAHRSSRKVLIADDFDLLESGDPEPSALVGSDEAVRRLMGRLDTDQAMLVGMRLEGVSNHAIALRLGTSERTVRRRFQEIRLLWSESGLIDPV